MQADLLLLMPEQALAVMEQRQGNTDEEAVNTGPQHVQSWQVRRPPWALPLHQEACKRAALVMSCCHAIAIYACIVCRETPACISLV